MNGKLIVLTTKGSKFSPYFVGWSGRGVEAFVADVARHLPFEVDVLAIVAASSTEVSALQAEALQHGERVFGNWFARSHFLDQVVAALGAKAELRSRQPDVLIEARQITAPPAHGDKGGVKETEGLIVC